MIITFANNKLKKCANKQAVAVKELGLIRAKKFKQRLDDLGAISNLEEAKNLNSIHTNLSVK